ncbi:MAG TPA: hypothetical protein VF092_18340 [Longimicrobium sp.]
MKKLRLEMERLQVESFETAEAVMRFGTVRARSGTEMTICFGLCGEHTEEAFGCGGADTEGCTNNPYIDDCYSYAQQCPMTVYPSATCYGTCGAPGGDSVCGGAYVCTDGCTV